MRAAGRAGDESADVGERGHPAQRGATRPGWRRGPGTGYRRACVQGKRRRPHAGGGGAVRGAGGVATAQGAGAASASCSRRDPLSRRSTPCAESPIRAPARWALRMAQRGRGSRARRSRSSPARRPWKRPRASHASTCTSAAQMADAVMGHVEHADIFIAVAAVADYAPEATSDRKLKKSASLLTLNAQADRGHPGDRGRAIQAAFLRRLCRREPRSAQPGRRQAQAQETAAADRQPRRRMRWAATTTKSHCSTMMARTRFRACTSWRWRAA